MARRSGKERLADKIRSSKRGKEADEFIAGEGGIGLLSYFRI